MLRQRIPDLDPCDAGRHLTQEDAVTVKLEPAQLEPLQGGPHQRLHSLKQHRPAVACTMHILIG